MGDYLFDPKTGKAVHYTKENKMGINAENTRRMIFSTNLMQKTSAKITEEQHNV